MLVEEYFFAFHRRATLKDIKSGASVMSSFGHVEAFGYTMDDTWFFFDPGRKETSLFFTHLHDEIESMMAEKFNMAHEVISTKSSERFRMPIHMPMNCVTQCAALVGIRAFTPNGFRKKLLRNEGVIIHGPERRS